MILIIIFVIIGQEISLLLYFKILSVYFVIFLLRIFDIFPRKALSVGGFKLDYEYEEGLCKVAIGARQIEKVRSQDTKIL